METHQVKKDLENVISKIDPNNFESYKTIVLLKDLIKKYQEEDEQKFYQDIPNYSVFIKNLKNYSKE